MVQLARQLAIDLKPEYRTEFLFHDKRSLYHKVIFEILRYALHLSFYLHLLKAIPLYAKVMVLFLIDVWGIYVLP